MADPGDPGGGRPRVAPVEIRFEVAVAADVEQTWAAGTDWDRQGEWMLGTRVRGTEQGGRGVGGGIRAVTGIGPVGIVDTMVITKWTPPHACAVRHTGRFVRGTGTFEVVERPSGATFVWSEQLDLPFGAVGRFGWRFAAPPFEWALRRSLRGFAAWAADYRSADPGSERGRG